MTMWVVTDRGADFSAEQLEGLNVQFVPMRLSLDGRTYSSGEDLTPAAFYELLEKTEAYPTTSQASAGDFAALYRRLAQTDPEILSIHISSGLSGTLDSARSGAEMTPEARVTFWDSKTLSCPQAWQVEFAARALQVGWPLQQVLERLERIRAATEGMFTLDTLKYLIHGGRISHLKGLLASLLHIRPVIGVSKDEGKYYMLGQERTPKKALQAMASALLKFYPEGSRLRVQLLHGKNPDAVAMLRDMVSKLFECVWLPTAVVGPILGAHTGGSLAGICAGPAEIYEI
ncbi:DegV family protein [Anaerolinea thermolimosa]|uniref:DegV family protein n=1 Tax=Anaerolinea thermolimosa TaxID=229919 RepID=UPI0009FD9E75|nr:DegV family protein [Anaerolinea thermolimosa]